MQSHALRSVHTLIALSAALLSACGGGGGGAPQNPPSNPPPANPQPGSLQLSTDALSVDENAGTAQLTIARTGGDDGAVTVKITTSNGSATAGQDYTSVDTTVSFAADDVTAKVVTVPIADDAQTEVDETLTVTLSAPTGGATLGARTAATITIRASDSLATPVLQITSDISRLIFTWAAVPQATSYRLFGSPDGVNFTQIGNDHTGNVTTVSTGVAVLLHDWLNARYRLEACKVSEGVRRCSPSALTSSASAMVDAIAYLKGTFAVAGDAFGSSVALSADGRSLAIGAPLFDNFGNVDDDIGMVYVFTKVGGQWAGPTPVVPGILQTGDRFGSAVALNADGTVLVVGAPFTPDLITGDRIGAAYVFERDAQSQWGPSISLKRPFPLIQADAAFGSAVAVSPDGERIVVGAPLETINGTDAAGGAWDFVREPTIDPKWAFNGHLWAPTPMEEANFGDAVALSDDDTFAIAASRHSDDQGLVYVFTPDGQGGLLADIFAGSNSETGDSFANSLALSADGDTLVVGARNEDSNATGVNHDTVDRDQDDDSLGGSGAAYVFVRDEAQHWSQQAYVKASNPGAGDAFGEHVALSADGSTLAVGARNEDSTAIGVGGDDDNAATNSGAVYVFRRGDDERWSQRNYVKASNTFQGMDAKSPDEFGSAVALSGDGTTLAVGARSEDSNATGVDGDQGNRDAVGAGAVYLY